MHSFKALIAGAAMLVAADASAGEVHFNNLRASWSDATPSGAFTYTNNNSANPLVQWGESTGQGRSGYEFQSAGSSISVTVPPSPSDAFVLGEFTHHNKPVTGTSLESLRLTITADIMVDLTSVGPRTFVFDFLHDETPNQANPCMFGGANGQGINANGCADRVRVTANDLSESFKIGSDTYTLSIIGFMQDGVVTNQFFTRETIDNLAELIAQVSVTAPPQTNVPEPATGAVMLAGLAALAAARRKR